MPGATGPLGEGEQVVEQGDCLESIAFKRGMLWKTLWEAPENAVLREKRETPTALLPGDNVHLPELRQRQESGATEQKHRFRRKGIPAKLVIVLRDAEGNPRAGLTYRLEIDGKSADGTTDERGRVEEPLRPDAERGLLTVGADEQYVLLLRHLDPASEASGLQARLRNLGYYSGAIDAKIGPATTLAVAGFQRDHGLDPTGEIDSATANKLQEAHGG